VGKVRVINGVVETDSGSVNTYFSSDVAQTIFKFGEFSVTSNFEGRTFIDYSGQLSTFVKPITLETMGVSETQSEILNNIATSVILNLDNSDLNTFIRFGSAYEFLRYSIEQIILNYPASLFVNSQININGNTTFYDYSYNSITNLSTLKVPVAYILNKYGLVYDYANTSDVDNNQYGNLNINYNKYIIWASRFPDNNSSYVVGFTGYTSSRNYLTLVVEGNPFFTTGTSEYIDFHIKPNNVVFEEFRTNLNDYEKYILSERDNYKNFKFTIKTPTLLDNGSITYNDTIMLWPTYDGYNIDIDTTPYRKFLESLLTIASKYDTVKTDLIARFLSPSSLKTYDLTDESKMTKLLRIYGYEFDRIREFIDSLVCVNKITYDKVNNAPDLIVKNIARTFGWDYFSLINENELVESFLSIDDTERNLNTDLLPAQIDIELWRRIIMNSNYFWKCKGTREAIRSMFLLIGIPEPFINITEYVYTVDGKIDPRTVTLSQFDFPSNSLPYNTDGYPVAPLENNEYYFQVSGDTDGGQAYFDAFRLAGFDLLRTIDNKKSWVQTGATTRIHYSTPQYYQEDSKLVLNTKEVNVSLDTSRGVEFDVFAYIKDVDFPINSTGYTLPISFVNISLGYTGTQNTFTLPSDYKKDSGDLEVRFNGILLNPPKEYDVVSGSLYDEYSQSDYIFDYANNTIMLNDGYAKNNTIGRDVIEVSYVKSGDTNTLFGITIKYLVTRIKPNVGGTVIPLPTIPNGNIQLSINGIVLAESSGIITGDYSINPTNSAEIILQNSELISYLAVNPFIQIAYITVEGSTTIGMKNETHVVSSFSSGKFYYNEMANKNVYVLNYKINNVSDIKVLINGIALEPGTDYMINSNNPYEIYLPRGIKYNHVISVYYVIGGDDFFDPIISNDFGLGDISKLSFLEFIELIEKRLINAKNRKIITDFKGGWYPTLLYVYVSYLKRAKLPSTSLLQSNGYTFTNLYSFLSKYNSFFKRFVDQLLPATIILKKSGQLIRNSVFTKQKFTYKRGVNMGIIQNRDINGLTTYKNDNNLQYRGNDGSLFVKKLLEQNCEWSDDYICVDCLCSDFSIGNITVTYPITTTTTTAYPYNGIITLNSELTLATNYSANAVAMEFSPVIIPSYSVTVNLNITMILTVTGTDPDEASGIVSIYKNSVLINKVIYTNSEVSVVTEIEDVEFVIDDGDEISFVVENSKTTNATSETSVLVSVIEVNPNGSINDIVPSTITNNV